jgi:hypothetical protein
VTPDERETFYDEQIAPVLLDLAKKCQDNGLSIAAMVEWDPGETGRTAALAGNSGFGIRMVEMAMRCHGNVDSLIMGLMKYGTEHGHNSASLHLLGVPTSPLPLKDQQP